jgi:cell division protein FtsL
VAQGPFARAARARTGSVLDALLSGKGWIVLVGVLLAGIVFFNVDLLRMNRQIALTAEKGAVLKRENARLRQKAALLGSSERIQDAAAKLGLVMPAAGDVRYLRAHPGADARRAARRIVAPSGIAAPVAAPAPVTPAPATDPTAVTAPTGATTTTTPETATPPAATTTPQAPQAAGAPGVAAPQAAPATVPPAG